MVKKSVWLSLLWEENKMPAQGIHINPAQAEKGKTGDSTVQKLLCVLASAETLLTQVWKNITTAKNITTRP